MVAARAALVALLLLPAMALAGGAHVAGAAEKAIRAGSHFKAARIASLTARDLRHASKADNISGLLQRAAAERRVDPDPMLGSRLWTRYNAVPSGDLLLLRCLQSPACDPDSCGAIAALSELHAQVLLRRPSLNLTQVNQAVGSISEQVMLRHFEASGWAPIEGQVGRTGIDGFFIKRDEHGTVRDVLFIESKYNTGALQPTNHGMQMSRDWLLKKLSDLRAKHPDDPVYPQVERYVAEGVYRARLWNMKVEGGALNIELQRVHSKAGDVALTADDGAYVVAPPRSISLTEPKNDFERALVRELNQALDKLGPKPDEG